MAYEAALSPQSLQQVYNYLRQARATGKVVTNRDVRNAYEAALAAEAKTSLLNRQISKAQENWQKQFGLQKEQLAEQQRIANLNQSNWEKTYQNTLENQKKLANSQNVLGGAALLLNAPKMIGGLKEMYGTGKDIYNWATSGGQGAAQKALEDPFGALAKTKAMQYGSTYGTSDVVPYNPVAPAGPSGGLGMPAGPSVGSGMPVEAQVLGDSNQFTSALPSDSDWASNFTSYAPDLASYGADWLGDVGTSMFDVASSVPDFAAGATPDTFEYFLDFF
jgi:hypothetical protein